MPKFSEFHRLNASQAQLDFVDVDNEEDTPVYVDPYAIELRNDDWSGQCSEAIRQFFTSVLDALVAGDRARATNLMSQLHEPRETFLGVSQGKPKGRGVGAVQADKLISAIEKSRAFQTGQLTDLSEMALYIDNIDRDKISDLTTNIIRSDLIKYTNSQCDLFGIPVYDYNGPPLWDVARCNWRSEFVKLPRIQNDTVLLVPKCIVRRRLSLDSDEFYKKQITDFLVSEHINARSSLVQTVKGQPKVYKTKVREKHKKSKTLISEIVSKNPELLDLYKKIAAERGELLQIRDDDETMGMVCTLLGEKLRVIPSGTKHASEYHSIVQGIITTLFYPSLILPHKEWEINDGRKRIDIVYTNDGKKGFLEQRRTAGNTKATMLVVECKNYSTDIANNEVDQLLGRFDNNRGYFGFITCREVDEPKRLLDRCRDAAKSNKGYILAIVDDDLHRWLNAKSEMKDEIIEEDLHKKFRDLIS